MDSQTMETTDITEMNEWGLARNEWGLAHDVTVAYLKQIRGQKGDDALALLTSMLNKPVVPNDETDARCDYSRLPAEIKTALAVYYSLFHHSTLTKIFGEDVYYFITRYVHDFDYFEPLVSSEVFKNFLEEPHFTEALSTLPQ